MASTQQQMQAARETDADSGAVGDLHAARAGAREPVETVGRSARNPAQTRRALRAGEERIANRASCKAVERRAVSPSAAQGVPNGLEGIPGTLRQFQALYGPYSGENLF